MSSNPVQKLAVKEVRFLPKIPNDALQVDFFITEWTSLLFPNNAPTPDI